MRTPLAPRLVGGGSGLCGPLDRDVNNIFFLEMCFDRKKRVEGPPLRALLLRVPGQWAPWHIEGVMNYRIVAIPESVAESVRATRKSPFARHPTHTEVARGHGPCRLCLRTFRVGLERRILFTYDPFADIESLPLPGPVFIHEAPCSRYREDGGFPDELRSHGLTLNAYQRPRILRAQEYVTNGEVEFVVARLWERPDIDYIHVRDTEAGCYDFRIERTGVAPDLSGGPKSS
jgi:hypothetical protein